MRSADGERDASSRPSASLGEREEPRRPVAQIVGLALLAVAALSAVTVASQEAPYAIERPGPVFDVLGDTSVGGEQVPMIEITGAETHATDGALDMLTVNANDPDHLPTWLQVVEAYLDPTRAVVPIAALYPPSTGTTTEDLQAEEMTESQQAAIAAALTHLGFESDTTIEVTGVMEGQPADGVLEVGDVIVAVDGTAIDDVDALREAIAANGTAHPATVVVSRDGARREVEITPRMSDAEPPAPVLGILVGTDYHWPIDVRIQLENVGGPSAGLMFALGIIDKLDPESLTGGQSVAGTGTIDADGTVGAIGGIRQKLYGAVQAGAQWFLAPAANCDEVVGHVPGGLRVAAVGTLDDALAALRVIASGGDPASLESCEAVMAKAAG